MSHQALEHEIEELSQETLERYEEVNILYRLVDSFRDVFDEREILDRLRSEAARSVHATRGWIAVMNGEGKLGERVRFGETLEPGESTVPRGLEFAARSMAENRALSLEIGAGPQEAEVPLMSVPLPG